VAADVRRRGPVGSGPSASSPAWVSSANVAHEGRLMAEKRVWPWFALGFVLVLLAGLAVLGDASWTDFLGIVFLGTLVGLSIFAFFYSITHAWRRYRAGWVLAIILFPGLALLYLLLHASEPMLASRPEQRLEEEEAEPETKSWFTIGVIVVMVSIVFLSLTMISSSSSSPSFTPVP
jgi:hypothetical protein